MNRVPSTIELTDEQANNLIFAIVSDSYEEYMMRCAVSGIKPVVSPAAFWDSDPPPFRRSPLRHS